MFNTQAPLVTRSRAMAWIGHTVLTLGPLGSTHVRGHCDRLFSALKPRMSVLPQFYYRGNKLFKHHDAVVIIVINIFC